VPWKLTVRTGPRVERRRFPELEPALHALEARVQELSDDIEAHPRAVDARIKRFEPGQQVAARIEIAGPERLLPHVRAGLDIRGDGSLEAYTGRVRRELIKLRRGESATRALRRVVSRG
jgi:hypothetical protein